MKRSLIIAAITFAVHFVASGIMMFVSYYFEFMAKPASPGVHHWLIHRTFEILIFPGWMLSELLIRVFGDIGSWITPVILLPSSIVWTGIVVVSAAVMKRKRGVPNNSVEDIVANRAESSR
jgi:hypothetical protein